MTGRQGARFMGAPSVDAALGKCGFEGPLQGALLQGRASEPQTIPCLSQGLLRLRRFLRPSLSSACDTPHSPVPVDHILHPFTEMRS